MDFESILAAIQPGVMGFAILGAAAIYAQIQFCVWAVPKVARFFIMRRLR